MSSDPTITVLPERPEKMRFKNTIGSLKKEFDTIKYRNRILESQVLTLTGQKESLEISDIENKSEIERLQDLHDQENSFRTISCNGTGTGPGPANGQVSILQKR